jgi:hypothetical protein
MRQMHASNMYLNASNMYLNASNMYLNASNMYLNASNMYLNASNTCVKYMQQIHASIRLPLRLLLSLPKYVIYNAM